VKTNKVSIQDCEVQAAFPRTIPRTFLRIGRFDINILAVIEICAAGGIRTRTLPNPVETIEMCLNF
jgi:hypothetical protein